MTALKTMDLFEHLLGSGVSATPLHSGWQMHLQAKSPPQNIYRWYRIRVDQTLFGEWCLSLSYGRIGHRGQLKRSSCADMRQLHTHLRATLRKRLNAKNRIGCNYEIVSFSR